MRGSRLYLPLPLQPGQTLTLDEDSGHYLRTVLRLKAADALQVFNGDGGEYAAVIAESSRKAVRVTVGRRVERSVESPLRLALGAGMARGDKMDWLVQKAVELGVARIAPLYTERCQVRLDARKQDQRQAHWQKIIRHAAEQCGRTVLPELEAIQPMADWLGRQHGLKLFLDPKAATPLAALANDGPHLALLTGPEGGFADHEREQAKAQGFIPVRLGARILRAETAAIATLAAAQTLWGDFR